MENKELTKQEKVDFIIQTEIKILSAIFKGHKASDGDEYNDDRVLMNQYRVELGLIKPKEKK